MKKLPTAFYRNHQPPTAHGCVGQKSIVAGYLRDTTRESIRVWKSSFYEWPLAISTRCPARSIKSACELLEGLSPSGRLAYIPTATEHPPEVLWAVNLDELRADGFSIAVCSASQSSLFKDPP